MTIAGTVTLTPVDDSPIAFRIRQKMADRDNTRDVKQKMERVSEREHIEEGSVSEGKKDTHTHSYTSTPLRVSHWATIESKPVNGAAAMATLDAELNERNFGEITDLPPSMPKGGGMKHAESMMSFHIDLGPSMLGDILSVMEKKGWEEDDLGYEEGKGSEGRASPSLIPHIDDDVEEEPPARPPRMYQQRPVVDPYTPELHARNNHHNLDSCSVSSSGSVTEDKPRYHLHDGDTDSAKYSSPRGEEDFTFMDEEDDDEIRV